MQHSTCRLSPAAFGVLLVVAALPAGARGDMAPLTPEQRNSFDQAIEFWGMGLLGGDDGVAYSVGVNEDHYHLAAPLNHPIGRAGARIEGDTLAASATPLDGGRWAIGQVQQPGSIRFVPPLKPDGSHGEGVSITQQATAHTSHTLIDPSLAATSSFDSTAEGVVVGIALPRASIAIKADRTVSHVTWKPDAGARVDDSGTTAAEGINFRVMGQGPGDERIRLTARRLTSERHAGGFAPRRLADAVRAGLQLLETAPIGKPEAPNTDSATAKSSNDPPALPVPKMGAVQRGLLNRGFDALHDTYGSLSQSVSLESVNVATHTHHWSLERFAASLSLAAPGGLADARLRVTLDGLASPDIPSGEQELLPQHVVIAQHLTGVPVGDAFAQLLRALDGDMTNIWDLTPDGIAALSRSPVTTSIDELSFDLGPAKVMASGSTYAVGRQDVRRTSLMKIIRLDALIERVGGDPLLRRFAPMLILLKGMGQQDGEVVAWKMVFADKKLMINGNDLSQLMLHRR